MKNQKPTNKEIAEAYSLASEYYQKAPYSDDNEALEFIKNIKANYSPVVEELFHQIMLGERP